MLSEQFLDNSPSEMPAPEATTAISQTSVWLSALSAIASKVSSQNFDLWFRPIRCVAISDSAQTAKPVISLCAPNRFIREWFETNYLSIVLAEIHKNTGAEFAVSWEVLDSPIMVAEPAAPATKTAPPPKAPAADRSARTKSAPAASSPAPGVEAQSSPQTTQPAGKDAPELIAKYRFESFVVGPSNQLAAAASRAVADNPAGKYNPLFIYGGVGLGKTHLLHAIGHQIQAQHPSWRILYLKTEAFMNEFICQVRNNRIEEFRHKYRSNTDVLLMDDIQYLGGKERTQDEFFHTFNELFESHRQIVVSADKYPHEIPDLEERIRSRFQWGLIADIQPPELETRIAILSKKAEYDKIDLPDEVAHYLAAHIKSNVRELEGLLIRVAAFASLQQRQITVEFVQETLKNFLTQSSSHLTVESVIKEVANYFNVKIADLKGTSRHASVTRPRQIAMYLSRKLCKASFPELGQKFGGKDHTTVLSACRRVESLLEGDVKTRSMVLEIERHLSQ